MEYANSRCNTLWFGQMEGHMQEVGRLMILDSLTYDQKQQIKLAMMYIKSSCEAITKQMEEAKEVA